MAGSAISVSIITIACIVCATMLVTVLYPAMNRASSSVTLTAEAMGDQIRTDIEIIEIANDTDASQPPYKCYIWVKNIGSSTIDKISSSTDVFFGATSNFTRMDYDSDISDSKSWNYIECSDADGRWVPKETLKIHINNGTKVTDQINAGKYYVKIILYNGESAEDVFSFST